MRETIFTLAHFADLTPAVPPVHLISVFACLRFPVLLNVCHGFWREPRASLHQKPISLELKNLVKEKIISQDTALRTSLDSLKWTIDDVSTIDLLFGDAPIESVRKYALHLRMSIIERWFFDDLIVYSPALRCHVGILFAICT